jgi:undecaprenyl-diphosphatase
MSGLFSSLRSALRLGLLLSLITALSPALVRAAADTEPAEPASPAAAAEPAPRPDAWDALVLGLVEGVTEFLPVSSTGHLIIANRVLGLDRPELVGTDRDGQPMTLKDAADTYAVLIQVGAIAAVAILYWSKLSQILAGLSGRDPAGLRLLRNLFLACLPPVVAALLAKDFIKTHLFSVQTVAYALLVGAALMAYAEWWRRRREAEAPAGAYARELAPSELGIGQALIVGAVQCLALWPGMSRSMSAMVGGYFVGLRPARAAEFSFLLGLPLLGAAAAKDTLDGGAAVVAAFGWANLLLGLLVAFVSAALAVKLFVGALTRLGLAPFALYRVVLALGLLWWLAQ